MRETRRRWICAGGIDDFCVLVDKLLMLVDTSPKWIDTSAELTDKPAGKTDSHSPDRYLMYFKR